MTKSELIERVADSAKLTKGRAELVVTTIFDAMVDALRRGDGIEIRGFGSFTVRQYKSYEGRNPRTGDAVHVSPKRLPFFKVGKELRARPLLGRLVGRSCGRIPRRKLAQRDIEFRRSSGLGGGTLRAAQGQKRAHNPDCKAAAELARMALRMARNHGALFLFLFDFLLPKMMRLSPWLLPAGRLFTAGLAVADSGFSAARLASDLGGSGFGGCG